MGLFGRRKKAKLVEDVMGEMARDVQIGQQLVQKTLGEAGLDMSTVLQAGAAAMQPGVAQQMMAYRDRVARLVQRGVETPATVRLVQLGTASPMAGGTPATVRLTVQPAGGTPYEADAEQVFVDQVARSLAPGHPVTVKVDPENPMSLMVWGTGAPAPAQVPPRTAVPGAPAPGAPVPASDLSDRVARLQELRDRGVLTQAEFEAAKAKLPDR